MLHPAFILVHQILGNNRPFTKFANFTLSNIFHYTAAPWIRHWRACQLCGSNCTMNYRSFSKLYVHVGSFSHTDVHFCTIHCLFFVTPSMLYCSKQVNSSIASAAFPRATNQIIHHKTLDEPLGHFSLDMMSESLLLTHLCMQDSSSNTSETHAFTSSNLTQACELRSLNKNKQWEGS